LRVGRLVHQVLVAQPLLVDGVDLVLDALFGGAGLFGLLVEGAQAQAQAQAAMTSSTAMAMRRRLRAGPRSA
jgi:hypothetical protein